MKSQKGVTLTSLAIYIVLIFITVGILTVIIATFQGNIKEIYAEGTNDAEIDKFNVFFLKEVKKQGNGINPIPEPVNEILFKTGSKYTYNNTDKCIYLNDNIKIAENIENCVFKSTQVNEKTVIIVRIKAVNSEEKTIEYVVNNENYNLGYEEEKDYVSDYYTELEYIESTGTQYIDTGIIPNQDTRVEIQVILNALYTDGNSNKGIIGSRTSGESNAYHLIAGGGGSGTEALFSGYGTTNSMIASGTLKLEKNVEYTIIKDKNITYVNEMAVATADTQNFTAPCPLVICAVRNGNSTPEFYGNMKLYYCKIWDDQELVRDFVPAKDKDGKVCLYDKIEKKNYYNQGSGEFIAGV